MEQKYASLALHLLTVVLLAVIAFELGHQPQPVSTSFDTSNLQVQLQALDKEVQELDAKVDTANGYLSKESTSNASLEQDILQVSNNLTSICRGMVTKAHVVC